MCRYVPSLSLAVVGCCWFGVAALLGLVVLLLRPRKWATACVTFGAAMEVVGYAMRSQSSQVIGLRSLCSVMYTGWLCTF